jgi:hypothetical protein
MPNAGTVKTENRSLLCWCGPGCEDARENGLTAIPNEASHGCCPSAEPVEQEPDDGCCPDSNGIECCIDDLAEHKLAQGHGKTTELKPVMIELPDFDGPSKQVLLESPPVTLAATAHGPPAYLLFEIFLI